MKTILPILVLLFVCSCKTTQPTATDDVAAIRAILAQQQEKLGQRMI